MMPRLRAWLVGSGKLAGFLLALNVFFVAIKLLGAFKGLGSGYGEILIQELAQNPFVGLFIGILITSVIQSSSTTTSITVGLVAAGVFGDQPDKALAMAIPIIMGANIGTSVTATIVAIGHIGNKLEFQRAFQAAVVHDMFNWLTVLVLLPLQVATNFLGRGALAMANALDDMGGLKFTSPIKYLVDPQIHLIKGWFEASGDLVRFVVLFFLGFAVLQAAILLARRIHQEKRTTALSLLVAGGLAGVATFVAHFPHYVFDTTTAAFLTGLGLLFAALWGMVTVMRSVVLDRVQTLFNDHIFKTAVRAFVLGMLLTALVQSSSVTTSLIVPLTGAGLLTLIQVFPYTLGANVGTTITAILAALSVGEVVGVATAFAHLLFNICGIAVFYPLRKLPIRMAELLSRGALIHPAIPVGVVAGMYIGLPLLCVAIFR
jgi:solute carrier family 34 (sodium-dependent phosphate cotransporter)